MDPGAWTPQRKCLHPYNQGNNEGVRSSTPHTMTFPDTYKRYVGNQKGPSSLTRVKLISLFNSSLCSRSLLAVSEREYCYPFRGQKPSDLDLLARLKVCYNVSVQEIL